MKRATFRITKTKTFKKPLKNKREARDMRKVRWGVRERGAPCDLLKLVSSSGHTMVGTTQRMFDILGIFTRHCDPGLHS